MEARPLVYIRTDGNETIATGNLRRCLSIARALLKRNAIPIFMVSDMTSISLLQKMMKPEEIADHVFPIIHMQTDYRDPEKELGVMEHIISSHNVSYLLVDSGFATQPYLAALGRLCRVAYLDDLQAFDYPVNLVINYEMGADRQFYKSASQTLCGTAYAPLRRQFSEYSCHLWETVTDIFISTGGTDPFDIAGGLVRRMLDAGQWKDSCFHVVTGPMHIHKAELEALGQRNDRVMIHENVTEMAKLMSECDLAVSAGGVTLYELCAVGVPAVSYSMADNQIPGARAFDEAGLIPWAGDIRNNPDFYENVMAKLEALTGDCTMRRQQSLRMRMAVDGAGADRIAEALCAPRPA